MKKCQIFILLISFLLVPKFVFALGQMTQPIVIKNALRGERIQQEIIAVNSDKQPLVVKFGAEGQIKDWVNLFLTKDLKNQFATTTIPAQGTLRVIAILDIPNDALNGEYKGSISVSNILGEIVKSEESSATVLQKIDRKVTIVVSDKQEISIKNTSVIPNDYDLNIGEPLSIRIIYDNQGNVGLSPQVHLKIKKDEKNIYNVIYPYPENEAKVNPKAQYEIKPITVQTYDWPEGKYSAQLGFYHKDELLLEKQFQFSISKEEEENVFGSGIINSIGSSWPLILMALMLIFIIIWQFRKNSKIRKELNKFI